MARVHTHPCAVPNCDRPVVCSGYAVGSKYDGDLHCICEESPEPMLCEGHDDLTAEDLAEMDADAANKDEKEGA